MKCMCCSKPLTAQTTTWFRKKILVCPTCYEVATKQAAELKIARARAEEVAMQWLEQRVMAGTILQSPNLELSEVPGLRDGGTEPG